MPSKRGKTAVTVDNPLADATEVFGSEGNLTPIEHPEGNGRQVQYDEEGRQVGAQTLMIPQGMELAEMELPDLDPKLVPTVAKRLAEAKMPVQVSADQILGHDVLWIAWRPQAAVLPGDGTVTDGFFAVGKDLETGKAIAIFIGGIALCRTLRNVKAPMVARIGKRGRTLVFQ